MEQFKIKNSSVITNLTLEASPNRARTYFKDAASITKLPGEYKLSLGISLSLLIEGIENHS
jgi:hypothetical protein